MNCHIERKNEQICRAANNCSDLKVKVNLKQTTETMLWTNLGRWFNCRRMLRAWIQSSVPTSQSADDSNTQVPVLIGFEICHASFLKRYFFFLQFLYEFIFISNTNWNIEWRNANCDDNTEERETDPNPHCNYNSNSNYALFARAQQCIQHTYTLLCNSTSSKTFRLR